MTRLTLVTLAAAALLAGCASPAGSPLANTAWRLVSLQSTRIDDDATQRYTMRLDDTGRAALRIDCNRASGSWRASGGATSGSFGLGPLAMTRMACPEPTLERRVAAQLDQVRAYRLERGLLHLSTGDGAMTWAPIP